MVRKGLLASLVALSALAGAACGEAADNGGGASANAARPANSGAAVSNAPPPNVPPPAATDAVPPPAPPPTQTQMPAQMPGAARRISIDEALPLLDRGQAVIVDVRTVNEYNASHARGALSVPHDAVAANLSKLPKNKLIITYCA